MDTKLTRTLESGSGLPMLWIHGFTGTPWDYYYLMRKFQALPPETTGGSYRIRALRLPGHGRSPRKMIWVSHGRWSTSVDINIREMGRQNPVTLVGHSMGALLALAAAARNPDLVGPLVLIAPAWHLKGTGAFIEKLYRLKLFSVYEFLRPFTKLSRRDIADPTCLQEALQLEGYPTTRLRDLFTLRDQAASALPEIDKDILILSARNDRVVQRVDHLHQELIELGRSRVKHVELGGGHIMMLDSFRDQVVEEMTSFLRQLRAEAP